MAVIYNKAQNTMKDQNMSNGIFLIKNDKEVD